MKLSACGIFIALSLSVQAYELWDDPSNNGLQIKYYVTNGCAVIGTENATPAIEENAWYLIPDKHLNIPSVISNHTVIGIASNAFACEDGRPFDLITYSIPSSITNVGVNAFGDLSLFDSTSCIVDGWLLGIGSGFSSPSRPGVVVLPKCIRGVAEGVFDSKGAGIVKFLGPPPKFWPRTSSIYGISISGEFVKEWDAEIKGRVWKDIVVYGWIPGWGDWDAIRSDGDYSEWIVDDNGYGMEWYYSVTNTFRYRTNYDGYIEHIRDNESLLTNGFSIVRTPGYGAYYQLQDKDVVLPSYLGGHPVREIAEKAFYNSESYGSISISSNVTQIGASAFEGTSITNVIIPPSVTNIGENAFYKCDLLRDQEYEYGYNGSVVTSGGWVLTTRSNAYVDGELPNGIFGIAGGAFTGCSVGYLRIPASVKLICKNAFACASVGRIDVAEGNEHFCSSDGVLFNADKTELIRAGSSNGYGTTESYSIPTGVVNVCEYAFFGNQLSNVRIPETVTHIGRWAFAGCFDSNITIKDGWVLTATGDYNDLYLPANLRGIADGALHDRYTTQEDNNHQRSLSQIGILEFMGNPPVFLPQDTLAPVADLRLHSMFSDSWSKVLCETRSYDATNDTWIIKSPWIDNLSITWIEPLEDGGPYRSADEFGRMWYFIVADEGSIIQSGESQYGESQYYEWQEVAYDEYGQRCGYKPLVLPSVLGDHPVVGIGDGAFSGGRVYADQIVLSSNITSIGNSAFAYCSYLRKINIPGCVTNIGMNAFLNCPLITDADEITLVDGWLLSAKYARYQIDVPEDAIGIAAGAFAEYSLITNITFNGAQPMVCEGSFDGIDSNCVFVVVDLKKWKIEIPGVWCGHTITYRPHYDGSIAVTADKEDGATFIRRTNVALSTEEECTIYYTTDGSNPTVESSVYHEPILVEKSLCLKYFAVSKRYGDWGSVGSTTLTKINSETEEISTSTSIPDGVMFAGTQKVSLIADGCDIYYTTDNSDPRNSETRRKYDAPITLTETTTIKYYAVDDSGDWSPVKTATYMWHVPAVVTADKEDGATFIRRTTVALSTEEECTIYYTTDGSNPTVESSVYHEPILVEKSLCLKYFAVSKRYGDWGSVGSTTLTKINSETEEISTSTSIPDGVIFAGTQKVSLIADGCDIYYTTDNSDPRNSETRRKYDAPITLTETTTIKYYAVDDSGDWSPVKTATFTWRAPDGWYHEKINGIVWGCTIEQGQALDARAYSEDANGGLGVFDYNADMVIPSAIGNCPVISLAKAAFSKTEITSATIPEGVVKIGRDAFRECMSLTNVVIPVSVTNIGYFAFRDCRKLRSIIMKCDVVASAVGAFDGTAATMTVPRLTGFVTVITEIKGDEAISIPESWKAIYPAFDEKFGSDFAKALTMKSGKLAADGTPLLVWHDYVAGTDPTDESSQFTASIAFDESGKPTITYSPQLSEEETARRKYTTYGKVRLQDDSWSVVNAGEESYFNFFKVTVEIE